MSSPPHLGGSSNLQITEEEHNHSALARSVVIKLLNLAATAYGSPSLLEGTDGNAMMVAIADPTLGTAIDLKNPGSLADGALSTSVTALYTATAKTWITKATFRNTGASTRVVTFAFKSSSSGTSRAPWPAVTLLTHESVDLVDGGEAIGFSVGNQLLASQDAGTDVEYVITGEALS